MRVGVDIGGTFTDFCVSANGHLTIHKVLSTPHDPAQAMLTGLAAVSSTGLSAIRRISHGSTVATNAILERKGLPTALITTQGFRDILAIGRQNRPFLYALQPRIPPPLIPRRWCYEIPERLEIDLGEYESPEIGAQVRDFYIFHMGVDEPLSDPDFDYESWIPPRTTSGEYNEHIARILREKLLRE